ncbi:hypothetical protein [Candidatus Clostridium helianthi]|uniref:Uncharacterized protein n=1 Tax=Candidatus Clostridium helianthi TaxID=3381660 RepID=A0ABW8SAQ4_9CLOT
MINDEIFRYVIIRPKSCYPVAGGTGKENTFIIEYTLFEIYKSFEVKSEKDILSVDDLNSFILKHEMNDYIKSCKCEGVQTPKPLLGIKPHFAWIEQRIDEIIKAMDRYREAKKGIPKDWYLELAQLETEKNRVLSNMTYLSIDADEIEESLKKNFQNSFVKFFKQGR